MGPCLIINSKTYFKAWYCSRGKFVVSTNGYCYSRPDKRACDLVRFFSIMSMVFILGEHAHEKGEI